MRMFCQIRSVGPSHFGLVLYMSPRIPGFPRVPVVYCIPYIMRLNVNLTQLTNPIQGIRGRVVGALGRCNVVPRDVTSVSAVGTGDSRPMIGTLRGGFPICFCATRRLTRVRIPRPDGAIVGRVNAPDIDRTTTLLDTGGSQLLIPGGGKRGCAITTTLSVEAIHRNRVRVINTNPNSPSLISMHKHRVLRHTSLVLCTNDLIPGRLALYTGTNTAMLDSTSVSLRRRFRIVGGFCSGKGFVMHLRANSPYVCNTVRRRVGCFSRRNVDCRVAPNVSSFRTTTTTLGSRFAVPRGIRDVVLAHNRKHAPVPRHRGLRLVTHSRDAVYVFLDTDVTRRIRRRLLRRCPRAAPMTIYCRLA